ncbi:hypothetical protein P3T37_005696 [Kitasatospora sp. MAA4]|uniref:hypothetical protein n=1 Tax=Kitasatospora sp. MAA4 TaxID=3035093 RepID=UPI002473DAC3|nr:hypothetical protein [Kitasatospora sp. MAA4]MDH6136276.1 hypothetical protein [Kitasatospora sp. MAA4]
MKLSLQSLIVRTAAAVAAVGCAAALAGVITVAAAEVEARPTGTTVSALASGTVLPPAQTSGGTQGLDEWNSTGG